MDCIELVNVVTWLWLNFIEDYYIPLPNLNFLNFAKEFELIKL